MVILPLTDIIGFVRNVLMIFVKCSIGKWFNADKRVIPPANIKSFAPHGIPRR